MRWWAAVALSLAAVPANAQRVIPVGSELDEYVRILELDGRIHDTPIVYRALAVRSATRALSADSPHVWMDHHPLRAPAASARRFSASWLDPSVQLFFNSTFPRTLNDGAVWTGRGLSGTVTTGAIAAWGPLTAVLYPTFWWAQNQRFRTAPVPYANRSPFSYPFNNGIDWPQRPGTNAVATAGWGQSGIRLDWRSLTIGLTTEDLWWGPGYRNAIVMSNTAGGFPHMDLGIRRPLQTPIGQVEFRAIWGSLRESGQFDTVSTNNTRFLAGLTVGYRPSFLPGLSLGFTRVLYQTWPAGGLRAGDLFGFLGSFFNPGRVLPDGTFGNDRADQMGSVTARWVLPAAGFEAYVEFSRGDFAADLREFLLEPGNTAGLNLGFQKTMPTRMGRWRIVGEGARLGRSMQREIRGNVHIYYAHHLVQQGYTHHGQLLGAWIGPGSDSQYLGVDRYGATGRWGLFLERVRYDNDAFLQIFIGVPLSYLRQQVDLTAGATILRFAGPVDLGAKIELTNQLNRYYEPENDELNLKLTFTAQWRTR